MPAGSSQVARFIPETALLGRYAPDLTRDPVHVWLSKYHWLLPYHRRLPSARPGCCGRRSWTSSGRRYQHGAAGEPSSALRSACTLLLAGELGPPTCGGSAVLRRATTPATTGGLPFLPVVRDGTTITHAHPVSARHGLAWYEFDVNHYGILAFWKRWDSAKKVQIAKFDPADPKPAGM